MGNTIRKRIFVLADDAHSSSVKQTLENGPYHVLFFTSAQAFKTAMAKNPCDAVVFTANNDTAEHVDLLRKCRQRNPFLPILAIVEKSDISVAVRAAKAGANEIVEKPLHADKVSKAMQFIFKAYEVNAYDSASGKQLSDIEKTIVKLILKGHSSKKVAEMMNRSPRTIEDHRAKIMKKIGVDSLVDLAKYAVTQGFVDNHD
jgi:FixJ family two-component response regulator